MRSSWLMGVVALALVSPRVAGADSVVPVVDRTRVGANVEGGAFIDRGRFAGRLAILDGDELQIVKPDKRDLPDVACNLRDLGIVTGTAQPPHGLAFLAGSNELVVEQTTATAVTLVFFDQHCGSVRRVPLQLPANGVRPYIEGLAAIPATSAQDPGLLAVAYNDWDTGAIVGILVVKRTGKVVTTIVPAALRDAGAGVVGLGFVTGAGPDHFVASDGSEVYAIGFDGTVTDAGADPQPRGSEVIAQDAGAHVSFVAYQGDYLETTKRLVPVAGTTRALEPGLVRIRIQNIEHLDGEFLVENMAGTVFAVGDDYASHRTVVAPGFGEITDLAAIGPGVFAMTVPSLGELYTYSTVTTALVDEFAVAPASGSTSFVGSTGDLVVCGGTTATCAFYDWFGDPDGTIDFAGATGGAAVRAVTWRAASDGFALLTADDRVIATDLAGAATASFASPPNTRFVDLAAIDDGAFAGEVAAVELMATNRIYRLALP